MLVDLGRNDVGRVADYQTVQLTDVMKVERILPRDAHHVERDRLNAAGKTAFDALRAGLPAGTVSGAPKVRAMQIIDEVEPQKRGLYAGVPPGTSTSRATWTPASAWRHRLVLLAAQRLRPGRRRGRLRQRPVGRVRRDREQGQRDAQGDRDCRRGALTEGLPHVDCRCGKKRGQALRCAASQSPFSTPPWLTINARAARRRSRQSCRRTSSGSRLPASQDQGVGHGVHSQGVAEANLGVQAREPGVGEAGEEAVARADRVDGVDRGGTTR